METCLSYSLIAEPIFIYQKINQALKEKKKEKKNLFSHIIQFLIHENTKTVYRCLQIQSPLHLEGTT